MNFERECRQRRFHFTISGPISKFKLRSELYVNSQFLIYQTGFIDINEPFLALGEIWSNNLLILYKRKLKFGQSAKPFQKSRTLPI